MRRRQAGSPWMSSYQPRVPSTAASIAARQAGRPQATPSPSPGLSTGSAATSSTIGWNVEAVTVSRSVEVEVRRRSAGPRSARAR
jgi:hypothetical protein